MPPARVAVVIPTLDNAATLLRAVESAIVATDHANALGDLELHTEIVVVDDGSTDDTRAVLDCLAALLDPLPAITFKTASTGGNRGTGPARNVGVRHASAPLICFLDAEDEFLPPHLGICVRALLDDRETGYVWTRCRRDVPAPLAGGPPPERDTVTTLCIRRIWHEIVKGFPEHPDFRAMGTEDSFYRIVLRALVPGREIDAATVLVHRPPDDAAAAAAPSEAIVAALQERLDYIARLKSEISG